MFNKQQTVEKIQQALWADLQKNCLDNVISLIVYGTGNDGQYITAGSENNFLIVTTQLAGKELQQIAKLQKQWSKKYRVYPLFLTKQDILTSADIFPIEFQNMKESYTVAAGEDVFKNLEIPLVHLRAQCEYSLKGKLIILRQGYVENPHNLQALIKNSTPAFLLVFKNILKLLGVKPAPSSPEIIRALCVQAGLDEQIIIDISLIAEGSVKCSFKELEAHFDSYLQQLQKLAGFVDQLDVKK
ncbi:hypothetical protein ACFL4D_01640 [Candidatus Margulisiibacteriota bacterium]